jgi:hypothetical protein
MLVRRPDVATLIRRRGHVTSEPQHFKEEETDPAWAFAKLRRLGFGLVTVSHANLVGLIRIPRASTHVFERYRTTVLLASSLGSVQGSASFAKGSAGIGEGASTMDLAMRFGPSRASSPAIGA